MKTILIFCVLLAVVSAIYDGNDATKNQFPYLVYLSSPQFYCAGTLISDRHILTAGHCLMSIGEGQSAKIILGMHQNGYNKDGLTVWSVNHWIHEKFSMPLAEYDIGIAELPKSIHELVNNSRLAKPIKIDPTPNIDLDASEKEIIIAGWGHTSRFNPAFTAQYTNMELISINECMQYKSHYIESLTPHHICAKNNHGTPCDGDSGSAIVSTKTNKLIGVLSYVKDAENFTDMGCNDCKTKVPVVSTRISSYIDWISSKTKIDFSQPEKTCLGGRIVNSMNILSFVGCEIILGNLVINNSTFDSMSPEKLKAFKNVRKITGNLKVTANHVNFSDLSFFENLESLNENGHENMLSLQIYKTSLKFLGLVSLHRIHNSAIFIVSNKNLCYVDTIEWRKILNYSKPRIIKDNQDESKCEVDGEICSKYCLSSGCWGKGEFQCLEMGGRNVESNEVEDDGY